MKERKTIDEYHIEVNYGFGDGWESECVELTLKEAKQRVKDYKANVPQYPVRIKKRRVNKEEVIELCN